MGINNGGTTIFLNLTGIELEVLRDLLDLTIDPEIIEKLGKLNHLNKTGDQFSGICDEIYRQVHNKEREVGVEDES